MIQIQAKHGAYGRSPLEWTGSSASSDTVALSGTRRFRPAHASLSRPRRSLGAAPAADWVDRVGLPPLRHTFDTRGWPPVLPRRRRSTHVHYILPEPCMQRSVTVKRLKKKYVRNISDHILIYTVPNVHMLQLMCVHDTS